jgi:putative DNA primase/helicase
MPDFPYGTDYSEPSDSGIGEGDSANNGHRPFTAIRMADVAAEQVSWLWPGRIPLGKLVVLDGDPGVGKSTLALTFGAVVSTAGRWPDGTQCRYPGDVILLSAEDGLADTIRPRLDAADADVSRVYAVQGVPIDDEGSLRPPTLDDIAQLRDLIKATDARLVIIDVLMAYLPINTDSHRDQDVRKVLARLTSLAEATGCTVLLLRHLNKGKGDALYRGGGSIGIVGAARVGLLAATDPDDSDLRVLAPLKNNLAAAPPSLTYRLVPHDLFDVARVQWVGESSHSAGDLLAPRDDEQSAVTEAQNWLEDYLTQEGRCPSKDAKAEGRKVGHSQSSIDRAARKLNVIIEPRGFPRQTYWSLPI